MHYIIFVIFILLLLTTLYYTFNKPIPETFNTVSEEEDSCVNLCPVKKSLYDRLTQINIRIASLQQDAKTLKSYHK